MTAEPRLAERSRVHVSTPAQRLVVISNRVAPLESRKPDSGGLAVAIGSAFLKRSGLWFGWSGEVSEEPAAAPLVSGEGSMRLATLDLSPTDHAEYYIGFSNRVLWPLFHFRSSLVEYSRKNHEGYLRVNKAFARALAPILREEDLLWVHDYHLIPLGQELRRLGQRQPIGFFLHTPFPPAELFRVLPNHLDLARALCAYDLIGFQTASDTHSFRDYLSRYGGADDLGEGVFSAFGRIVRTQVFPISIDVDAVAARAAATDGSRHVQRLRQSLGDRALMIGVDRLDYSKGLLARFQAYGHLLEAYPQTHGRIVFIQVAPPSRSEVPEYRDIRKSLETAAGRINGRNSEFDWTPLRYMNKGFSHRVLTGFFRASRIALVTPLRDGMNLVAKEYVASQKPEDPGVLILSSFAGAADELSEAVLVNPYDIEGMAEAIRLGLEMPLSERRERWSAMMRVLRKNDLAAWREGFLEALGAAGASRG
jgi:trehalose 6-phosphate synthase